MPFLDSLVAGCLLPLAVFVLISGFDDLLLDLAMLARWARGKLRSRRGTEGPVEDCSEKRIAVFIPMWREHRVAAGMLEHNLAAIRYRNFHIFVGCYPNDEATLDAVRAVEARFPSVHLAVCPHDGPTSKADCLNWIYQNMLLHEQQSGLCFEIVVTHDAEDLIHPESLAQINRHSASCDMVQIPVLALPTPWWRFTHGVYCDEFAEYQTRDIPLRRPLGGFLPSNGVGTGYSRRALESLAEAASNRIFEQECLTEDYENGWRVHRLGLAQHFVPIRFRDGQAVATREYFPRRFRQAVRQRTRWVIGIALQSWLRHGWGRNLGEAYWFWRDRKGLLGNPVGLFSNLLFAYGLATCRRWVSRFCGSPCAPVRAPASTARASRWPRRFASAGRTGSTRWPPSAPCSVSPRRASEAAPCAG
jgi:adsorption protein B